MKTLKNYFYNTAYQLLVIFLPLVTAPYISRVLQPQGVGLNTITFSIVQYFVLFATLGTSTYGVKEIALYQNDKKKRSQTFWEINFLSWITSAISILCFLIFMIFIKNYKELYLWQGIGILAAMLDISWYFMGMEKFKLTVIRNFFFKILTVIAVFTFVHTVNDLAIYIAILSIGGLLSSLSLWPYLKVEINLPDFKNLNIFYHLKYTLGLFIPSITVQIYAALNSQMIGMFDSLSHAGFFTSSDKIIKISLSLVTSIGVVMLPRVSSMSLEKNHEGIRLLFIKSFNLITGVSIGILFGILGIALKFAPFFFGSEYGLVGPIMMIEAPIVVFTAWGIIISNQFLVPLNKLRPLTFSVVFGTIFNILLNFAMIPLFGVIGATINMMLSELLITGYKYYSIRKEFKLRTLFRGTWKYLEAGFAMFIVVFWLNQILKMTILTLLFQVAVGCAIYAVFNIILKTQLWEVILLLIKKNSQRRV